MQGALAHAGRETKLLRTYRVLGNRIIEIGDAMRVMLEESPRTPPRASSARSAKTPGAQRLKAFPGRPVLGQPNLPPQRPVVTPGLRG